MARNFEIDINKSLHTGFLNFNQRKSTLKSFEDGAFYFVCILLLMLSILILFNLDSIERNSKHLLFISLFAIISSIYGIYRKLNDLKIINITADYSKEELKEIMVDFLEERRLLDYKKSKECILVTEKTLFDLIGDYKEFTAFIVGERKLHFAKFKSYTRMNPPVFFSHYFLKADIEKFISNRELKHKGKIGITAPNNV